MAGINNNNLTGLEVAVVGLSCRFPGANDYNEYWKNIVNGTESITFLNEHEKSKLSKDLIKDPNYVGVKGGLIDNADSFDYSYFNYSPLEANSMDPQLRVYHEIVVDCLNNAGYSPATYGGAIGLYAGAGTSTFWEAINTLSSEGNGFAENFGLKHFQNKDFLTTLISYKLGLTGPCVTINTACSTSLVAIHMACQALLNGECDMALAGGIRITASSKSGYTYQEGMILSKDGHCRPFDQDASGTVYGEGGGIVALKLLEDAIKDGDNVLAIIKGSAINNDGNKKAGFTAPGIPGQVNVVESALNVSGVAPESISYVETHGTGTQLGDKIEIESLKQAFSSDQTSFCAIGGVKANIGHLDAGAGIAGFIKVVLMLQNNCIPPQINFNNPNASLDLDSSPFYVNTTSKSWLLEKGVVRAGISSFGIGGTNAHVILEKALVDTTSLYTENNNYIFQLSASSPEQVVDYGKSLSCYIKDNNCKLDYVSFTLANRLKNKFRTAVVASSKEELKNKLLNLHNIEESKGEPFTVFLFPGQGSQYLGMGAELYSSVPVFRDLMDQCFACIKKYLNIDPIHLLFNTSDSIQEDLIHHTQNTQPLLFSIEYSIALLLNYWGINARAFIGHSIGEYVAACLSGVLTVEDAIHLVVERGKLMQRTKSGAMISAEIRDKEVSEINTQIDIAAINSDNSIVFSGSIEDILKLEAELSGKNIKYQRLKVSNAFHSKLMDGILADFKKVVEEIKLSEPITPYISNITGDWINKKEVVKPEYWVNHLRSSVRFRDGVLTIMSMGKEVLFIEVGPGNTLAGFLTNISSHDGKYMVANTIKHKNNSTGDYKYLLQNTAKIFRCGVDLNLNLYHEGERQRTNIPSFLFNKKPMISSEEIVENIKLNLNANGVVNTADNINSWFYSPTWMRVSSLKEFDLPKGKGIHFFFLSRNLNISLLEEILIENNISYCFVFNSKKEHTSVKNSCYISSDNYNDYVQLFSQNIKNNDNQINIYHLWNFMEPDLKSNPLEVYDECNNKGLLSLVNIARSLAEVSPNSKTSIVTLTSNLYEVLGNERKTIPYQSPLIGAVKIIPVEYKNIKCKNIDIDLAETEFLNSKEFLYSIINENQLDDEYPVLSYRALSKWQYKITSSKLKEPKNNRIKQNGIYMVFGGMGGMGFSIAKFLAKKYSARVIIITRSAFPQREEWFETPSSEYADKINQIIEIESNGGSFDIRQCDIVDFDQVRSLTKSIKSEYRSINGIIHAAGNIDYGGIIQNRTSESIKDNMCVKTEATINLIEELSDYIPDFFVTFSSRGNVLFNRKFGQLSYNAANEFLESLTEFLKNNTRTFFQTINWCDWKDVGMSVRALKQKLNQADVNDYLMDGIHPLQGVEVFEKAINSSFNHITISPVDIDYLMRKSIDENEKELIFKKFKESHDSPSNIEEKIVTVFLHILGKQVNIHEDYFSQGLDSLKAMYVISQLQQIFHIELPLTTFYELSTISSLLNFIQEKESIVNLEVPKTPKKEYYRTSSAQKRLYILNELNTSKTVFNQPRCFKINKFIDVKKITDAVNILIRRHEALRTTFKIIDGIPYQHVHEQFEYQIKELEIEKLEDIKNLIQPFNLSKLPLFRLTLLKHNNDNLLFIDNNHIISDGISNKIFLNELLSLYQDEQLPEIHRQYKDFAEWQVQSIEHGEFESQRIYWKNALSGELPKLDLPIDFSRPAVLSQEGGMHSIHIKKYLAEQLNHLALQYKTGSVFTVLFSIYSAFLARITNQSELIIGIPTAGRNKKEFNNVLGMFVNTLPIRVKVDSSASFKVLVEQCKNTLLSALENQDFQFDDMVNEFYHDRDISRSPIFDNLIVFQEKGNGQLQKDYKKTFRVETIDFANNNISVARDLTVYLRENDDGFQLTFEYCTKLFKEDSIVNLVNAFETLIHEVIDNPDQPIENFRLVNAKEEQRIFNLIDNSCNVVPNQPVPELIEKQVMLHPEREAISFRDISITYDELNKDANKIARYLQKKGVKKNSLVALIMDRSPLLIKTIFGIWKLGAAYIPIGMETPVKRIKEIIIDSFPVLIITDGWIQVDNRSDISGYPLINISASNVNVIDEKDENLGVNLDIDDLAYIIYTSGSTGKPKGALVGHHGMLNHMYAKIIDLKLDENAVIAQNATYTFDISVWQLFTSLIIGAKVCIYPDELVFNAVNFLNTVIKNRITHLEVVPSYLILMLEIIKTKNILFDYLKYLVVTGEEVKKDTVKKWFQLFPDICLVNAYGPTEASDDITHYVMSSLPVTESIPIGYSIINNHVMILNNSGQLNPIGVKGEICVSGIGVGRGYLNNIERTVESFTQTSIGRYKDLYKTGDVGRLLEDGTIEFFGRKDHQVKIHGFRIELGEIEVAILSCPEIKNVVVNPFEVNGTTELCAYYVCQSLITIVEIKNKIRELIPAYMVPAYYMQLEDLPINSNGKIDRKKLSNPLQYGYLKVLPLGDEVDTNSEIDNVHDNYNKEDEKTALLKILDKFDESPINFETFNESIYDLVSKQIKNKPDSIAVVCNNTYITYKELGVLIDCIANNLIRNNIKYNDRIGIWSDVSVELPAIYFAINKIGAVFVHLDKSAPQNYLTNLCNLLAVDCVIVQEEFMLSSFPKSISLNSILIKDEYSLNVKVKGEKNSLVQMVTTSGSTGVPKGVIFTQDSLINYYYWLYKVIGENGLDRSVVTASLAYDIAYTQFYATLLSGKQLYLIEDHILFSAPLLCQFIQRNVLTLLKVTPTQLNMLIECDKELGSTKWAKSLKFLISAGEKLNVKDVKLLIDSNKGLQVINSYGPAEATIGSAYKLINSDNINEYEAKQTIGKTISNVGAFILNADNEISGLNEEGEIYIYGANVTGGYVNQSIKTDEKFFFHEKVGTIYKTGDIGKFNEDKEIVFIGRNDDQLKIGGFRIDPSEIERGIKNYPESKVTNVCVLLDKGESSVTNKLVAFIVADSPIVENQLREFLSKNLPFYMIPKLMFQIDRVPLTSNGKRNLKLLTKIFVNSKIEKTIVKPHDELEQSIFEIWTEILKRQDISVDDNFFDIGGSSLDVIKMHYKLTSIFNIDIAILDLFTYTSINNLAQFINEKQNNTNEIIQIKEYDELNELFDENISLFDIN